MEKYKNKTTGEVATFDGEMEDGTVVFEGEKGRFFVKKEEMNEWEPHNGN